MVGIIGIAITFIMVFGGYVLAGGKLAVILHSLPYEMIMIGGAAVGSFLLSNQTSVIKEALHGIKSALRGPKWNESDVQDLLCLLFRLQRIGRSNPTELEAHIDDPENSTLFQEYPQVTSDHQVVSLVCDTLRAATLNFDDPYQVEETLARRISSIEGESLHAPHALQNMADALPALGIVAAVLGVIKTMSAIDQPPEVLGKMIGGALVGTFLGVFLAYGIVAPFAHRLQNVIRQNNAIFTVIKSVLISGLHQHSASLSVEVGRQAAPEHIRPSFTSLDLALKQLKRSS